MVTCIMSWFFALGFLQSAKDEVAKKTTGFHAEVRVRQATRLDWEFAVKTLGPAGGRVSSAYDPRAQRYQLFVPEKYDAKKTWPLVLFISPGDNPLGWRNWQKACEDQGAFFCAAYGAGDRGSPARRVRVLLDVLDDLRRNYRIDPDRTYLAGFSGGAGVASELALALPEYFGGVLLLGGSPTLPSLAYLRQRGAERLAIGTITGEKDAAKQIHVADTKMFADLGFRTKEWIVPKMARNVPPGKALGEALQWLEADRSRRQKDALRQGDLAALPDGPTSNRTLAEKSLESALAELRRNGKEHRAVSQLEALIARYENTAAGEKAAARLKQLREDPLFMKQAAAQAAKDQGMLLAAKARSLARKDKPGEAMSLWRKLVKDFPAEAEDRRAAAEIKRLARVLAETPYLGIAFSGDTMEIQSVIRDGPADRAGLRRLDRIHQFASKKVGSPNEMAQLVRRSRPGAKVEITVHRKGKPVILTVTLGPTPQME
jgi:predicted esterase